MCDNAASASTIELPLSVLKFEDREHPENWEICEKCFTSCRDSCSSNSRELEKPVAAKPPSSDENEEEPIHLLPCPFCRASNLVVCAKKNEENPYNARVSCLSCNANGPFVTIDPKESDEERGRLLREVRVAWNTRKDRRFSLKQFKENLVNFDYYPADLEKHLELNKRELSQSIHLGNALREENEALRERLEEARINSHCELIRAKWFYTIKKLGEMGLKMVLPPHKSSHLNIFMTSEPIGNSVVSVEFSFNSPPVVYLFPQKMFDNCKWNVELLRKAERVQNVIDHYTPHYPGKGE